MHVERDSALVPGRVHPMPRMAVRRHPLRLAVPDGGCRVWQLGIPFGLSQTKSKSNSGGWNHEAFIEWNGDGRRPGYRCACVGANSSPDGALNRHAYATPRDASSRPSSRRSSPRGDGPYRQRCQPAQRPASGRHGASASLWPSDRALRSAEPDLWHSRSRAGISQPRLSQRLGPSIRSRTISGLSKPECSGSEVVA
jgi:hypothetical protein